MPLTFWSSSLIFIFAAAAGDRLHEISCGASKDTTRFIVDENGAIIRGDVKEKTIALVFTGDEFADGGEVIRGTLKKHRVHASFFLTGNFYANPLFRNVIFGLKKDGHYLGPHSDRHLLYADWTRRDSLLVTQEQFSDDLRENYKKMSALGVRFTDAPFFLPPFEWYNATIAEWTRQLHLQLVNYSPGTRSAADYTYPEMGDRYLSSEKIYRSIMDFEKTDPHGLNGFILLVHIGTDPRRVDKFYDKLDDLLSALERKGYRFITIRQLLGKQESTGANGDSQN